MPVLSATAGCGAAGEKADPVEVSETPAAARLKSRERTPNHLQHPLRSHARFNSGENRGA